MQVCLQPPGGAPATPTIIAAVLLAGFKLKVVFFKSTTRLSLKNVESQPKAGPDVGVLGLNEQRRDRGAGRRLLIPQHDELQSSGCDSTPTSAGSHVRARAQSHSRAPSAQSGLLDCDGGTIVGGFGDPRLCSSAPHSRLSDAESGCRAGV